MWNVCAKEMSKDDSIKNEKEFHHDSKYDTLNDVDAMILVTEWKEFRSPDFYEMKARMREPVVFDGRNQYEKRRMQKYGFEYFQIGVNPLRRGKTKA